MFGFALALIWFAFVVFIRNDTPLSGYHDSADFLFYWYVTLNGLILGLLALFTLFTTLGAGLKIASDAKSRLSHVTGFLGGSALGASASMLIIGVITFRNCILFVGGAWLLSHAADDASDISHLNLLKAVLGGLMVLVGIIIQRSSNNSYSSHTNDASRDVNDRFRHF